MATNHLGHFLLTQLLLDDLKKTAPSRVVVVSSEVHAPGVAAKGPFVRWTLEELNDPKTYDGMLYYKNSKLVNIWFCRELAKRLQGTGVTCNCLNPGFIPSTGLARDAPYVLKLLLQYVLWHFIPLGRTEDHGGQTIVDAATNPKWDNVSGEYFSDMNVAPSSEESQDMEKAARMWTLSESWVSGKASSK